jgi:hypothetical protein
MSLIINEVLLESNVPTRTGKIFSNSTLHDIANQKFIYGEFVISYEPGFDTDPMYVSVSKMTHEITNLRVEENKLIGDIQIQDNPNGKLLLDLIPKKVMLVPRGFGQVDKNNVVTNFKIIAFDYMLSDTTIPVIYPPASIN